MKAGHRNREVELKLAVRSDDARALVERELARTKPRMVESVYFDTTDMRIHSAGYALRVRRDRGVWIQTVKSDGPGAVERYENERSIDVGEPDARLLRQTPIGPITKRGALLAPVFATSVKRRALQVERNGARFELSFDEGDIIAGDRTEPILELEIELKSGSREGVFCEALRLATAGTLWPAFTSKAARGYDLAQGGVAAPPKFEAPRFGSHAPAGDVFAAIGHAGLHQLTRNADLIVDRRRPEAIHQARVALRRLRVALGVFKSISADGQRTDVKRALEWLTGELEDARNLDVFMLGSFEAAAAHDVETAPMAAFGQALLAAQHRAYDRAAEAARSPRFRALLLETARWLELGAWRTAPVTAARAASPVHEFAPKALDQRRRNLAKRLARLDWKDPLARHEVRIAAKKMRYASEFFAALASGRGRDRQRDFIAALEALQEGLGDLNDIWVGHKTAHLALESANRAAEGATFAAGVVVGRGLGRTGKLTRKSKSAAEDFLGVRPWW